MFGTTTRSARGYSIENHTVLVMMPCALDPHILYLVRDPHMMHHPDVRAYNYIMHKPVALPGPLCYHRAKQLYMMHAPHILVLRRRCSKPSRWMVGMDGGDGWWGCMVGMDDRER